MLRADRQAREDRLQALLKRLVRQTRRGRHKEAAEFLLRWTYDLHLAAVQARHIQVRELDQARAFGAAQAVIRRAQDEARKNGRESDLAEVDLQAVAEITAKHVLRGESISVTDVLVAIHDHTAVVPLAEWMAEAPTKH